jgi:hypothetical protein
MRNACTYVQFAVNLQRLFGGILAPDRQLLWRFDAHFDAPARATQ